MEQPRITVDGVSFGYGGPPVIEALSLEARRGEFLAVLGPNGCGKSTLLKVIAGLNRPSAGRVLAGGEDVSALSRRMLARRIAVLTQAGSPPPNMSVHEMIAMGRYSHQSLLSRRSREDEAAVARAVRDMQVEELLGKRVGALSGGQLQRCRMAMVLAQGSETLLLDEPTTYLDLKHQFGILDCARRQARAGRTVIAVLHDFTQASLYADRVAMLSRGRLAGLGTPEEVLTEEMIAAVFGVRTRAARAHGAVFHVPLGAAAP
ncbi:ABC transporter ATP-binding protein [Poseidonocella sp. HB161398]|uniref:ABC transporter ATP-binding protein n=1 Tax=Poseidonocella sp. HB161398 TaxID=2320855 RepID=UPI001486ED86|nr:ABC transporter ATP-binding protein [Poseidonocella sp. HB161398]